MPATFQELSTSFKDQYFPLDNDNIAYDKLCNVKYKGSMANYYAEFDTILLTLLENHPKEIIHILYLN